MIVLLVAATGCSPMVAAPPSPTPLPQPQKVAEAPKVPSREAWQEQWEQAVEASKKEGKIVVVSSGTVTGARAELSRTFKEKYGITVEWVSGPAAQVDQKMLAEQAAGLFLSDIYFGGSSSALIMLNGKALEPISPLLTLPEVTNPGVWFGGKLPYFDPEETAFPCLAGAASPVFVNTDLVKTEEIKSYRDLLNPKWKGKIVMQDPTKGGSGQMMATVLGAKIMGWDYLREIAKQAPAVTNDARQQTEWVARGKYPIGWGATWAVIGDFTQAGVPLKALYMAEGTYITASGGVVHLLKKAPHPNAAKVFINWVLTKEGQTIVQKGANYPSRRLDVSKEGMDPLKVPQPGQNYVDTSGYEWAREFDGFVRQVREILGPLVGK